MVHWEQTGQGILISHLKSRKDLTHSYTSYITGLQLSRKHILALNTTIVWPTFTVETTIYKPIVKPGILHRKERQQSLPVSGCDIKLFFIYCFAFNKSDIFNQKIPFNLIGERANRWDLSYHNNSTTQSFIRKTTCSSGCRSFASEHQFLSLTQSFTKRMQLLWQWWWHAVAVAAYLNDRITPWSVWGRSREFTFSVSAAMLKRGSK